MFDFFIVIAMVFGLGIYIGWEIKKYDGVSRKEDDVENKDV